VSVLASDIGLFSSIASYVSSSASSFLSQLENLFIFPPPTDTTIPHSIYAVALDPVGAAIYVAIFIVLSLVFGVLWVNVAGLDARTQAENLIESGVEVPGIRSNPRALEGLLAKYIKPLTFYSSLIVGILGSVATLLGVYGTGVGLLLAVTIAIQYYSLLAYERSLEMYPLLKRIIGEE
jgi:protein translocase subunit secY/sec61 alpha